MARLHANGQRWVPILDPGIHIRSGYYAYDSGVAQDVFLRDISGGYYVGQVNLFMESCRHNVQGNCAGTIRRSNTLCVLGCK